MASGGAMSTRRGGARASVVRRVVCMGLAASMAVGAHALDPITDSIFTSVYVQCQRNDNTLNSCPANVVAQYGEMADWDVSQMTNFDMRFMSQSSFTADISRWNTSSATSMKLRIVGILEVHVHRVRQPHVRRQVPHRQRAAEALAVSVVHSTEICRTGMSAR